MKTRRNIVLGVLAIVFAVLIFKIVVGFKELNKAMKNQLPSTHTLPEEDYTILSPKYVENVKVNEVIRNKLRYPMVLCDYDKSFSLIIYKINLKSGNYDFLTKKEFWKIDRSVGVPYESVNNDRFRLQFQEKNIPDTAVQIILSYNGNLIYQKNSGDSIKYLRLNDDRFAIKYGTDSPRDILLETKNNENIDVLFLTRKKSLFFLTMVPNYPKVVFPDSLLYKIVTGN